MTCVHRVIDERMQDGSSVYLVALFRHVPGQPVHRSQQIPPVYPCHIDAIRRDLGCIGDGFTFCLPLLRDEAAFAQQIASLRPWAIML